jgi:hypothetical protein
MGLGVGAMSNIIKKNKLVSPLLMAVIISLVLPLPVNKAHAGYLVPLAVVVPVTAFPEPPPCLDCACYNCARPHKKHHKKPRLVHKKKHYRHKYRHCYAAPPCVYQYDFVSFAYPPCAPGPGGYVNLYEYENYDPDLATGDDDPTIYPGMNIDN